MRPTPKELSKSNWECGFAYDPVDKSYYAISNQKDAIVYKSTPFFSREHPEAKFEEVGTITDLGTLRGGQAFQLV